MEEEKDFYKIEVQFYEPSKLTIGAYGETSKEAVQKIIEQLTNYGVVAPQVISVEHIDPDLFMEQAEEATKTVLQ